MDMQIEYLKKFNKAIKSNPLHQYDIRRSLIDEYSFAVPTKQALQAVKDLNLPIVELGAGSGYWAYLLQELGVDITPIDYKQSKYFKFKKEYTHILTGSYELLKNYPDHALMLCWPDYDTDFALKSLKNFKGSTFIYIGEGISGCTGCEKFHRLVARDWTLKQKINIPTWTYIYDSLYIFTRNI